MASDQQIDSSAAQPGIEVVDGPAIAAAILKAMPAPERERIMQAIELRSPQLAKQIEDRSVAPMQDITELSNKHLQRLVQSVNQRDLAVSLISATEEIRSAVMSNVSERKRRMLEEDLAILAGSSQIEIKEAQMKVRRMIEELRSGALGGSKQQSSAIVTRIA